jgi:MYXO-CTERM domain-containing protein
VRRRLAAAAAAAVLAAAPAAAYVRTRDRSTGKELSWPVATVPWYLNRDWPSSAPSCQATGAGDPTSAAVRAGFAAWQQSCAHLRLLEGGATPENRIGSGGTSDNIVVFRRGWCSQNSAAVADPCFDDPAGDCSNKFDCFDDDACRAGVPDCSSWNLVALTSVLYEPDTGRIIDADIEIVGWDGVDDGRALPTSPPQHGWYFTCGEDTTICQSYGEGACRFMDLQNTVTHEAGHFIGLAHAPDPAATMFATTRAFELDKRSLSADDIAGVCAIYPPEDSGGCGCGTGGAGGAVALLVAALALRRRRAAR